MTISIDLIKKLREMTLAPLGDCKEALVEANGDVDQAQEILRKKGAIKAGKKADRETNAGVVRFAHVDGVLYGIKLLCETDFVSKNDTFSGLVDQLLAVVYDYDGYVNPQDEIPASLTTSLTAIMEANSATIGENMRVGYVIRLQAGYAGIYNHMNNALSAAIIYTTADGSVYNDAAKDVCLQVAAMNPLSITMADISADRIDALRAEFTEEMKESGKPVDMIAKIVEGKVSKAVQDDVLLEQMSIKDQTRKIKDTLPVGFVISSMYRVSV